LAFQEWKFLHSSSNSSSTEDGANAIEKLHVTSDHMVSGYDPKGYTYMELDRLACIIKNRLDRVAEEVGMLDNCYPIMDVVEEMKYLFDRSINTSCLFSTGAFQGNSGDYYDYCNSLTLIAEVSFFTLSFLCFISFSADDQSTVCSQIILFWHTVFEEKDWYSNNSCNHLHFNCQEGM
jgi:hypothetical protein